MAKDKGQEVSDDIKNKLTEYVYSACVAKKDGSIPETVEMMVGGIPKEPTNLLSIHALGLLMD